MTISNELLDELLKGCKRPDDLLGEAGHGLRLPGDRGFRGLLARVLHGEAVGHGLLLVPVARCNPSVPARLRPIPPREGPGNVMFRSPRTRRRGSFRRAGRRAMSGSAGLGALPRRPAGVEEVTTSSAVRLPFPGARR